jgi:pimeloyl-ACP methyl ester carboxylesterase
MATRNAGAGFACQYTLESDHVSGLPVEYFKGGKGPPLLYMHGLGRWANWDSDHIGLALTHNVFAPTLPGWKSGQLPSAIKSVEDYAALMIEFLDHQKLDSVDIVANSFGGWVAAHIALRAPERVSRLVLVNAMGIDESEAPASNIAGLDTNELYAAAFAAKSGIMVATGDFGGIPLNLKNGEAFKHMIHGQRNLAALTGGVCGEPGLAAKLDTLSTPTLLVWGEDDQIVPLASATVFRAHIPGSRLVQIQGAGNCPQKEKPNTFVGVVSNFLAGHEKAIVGASVVA